MNKLAYQLGFTLAIIGQTSKAEVEFNLERALLGAAETRSVYHDSDHLTESKYRIHEDHTNSESFDYGIGQLLENTNTAPVREDKFSWGPLAGLGRGHPHPGKHRADRHRLPSGHATPRHRGFTH